MLESNNFFSSLGRPEDGEMDEKSEEKFVRELLANRFHEGEEILDVLFVSEEEKATLLLKETRHAPACCGIFGCLILLVVFAIALVFVGPCGLLANSWKSKEERDVMRKICVVTTRGVYIVDKEVAVQRFMTWCIDSTPKEAFRSAAERVVFIEWDAVEKLELLNTGGEGDGNSAEKRLVPRALRNYCVTIKSTSWEYFYSANPEEALQKLKDAKGEYHGRCFSSNHYQDQDDGADETSERKFVRHLLAYRFHEGEEIRDVLFVSEEEKTTVLKLDCVYALSRVFKCLIRPVVVALSLPLFGPCGLLALSFKSRDESDVMRKICVVTTRGVYIVDKEVPVQRVIIWCIDITFEKFFRSAAERVVFVEWDAVERLELLKSGGEGDGSAAEKRMVPRRLRSFCVTIKSTSWEYFYSANPEEALQKLKNAKAEYHERALSSSNIQIQETAQIGHDMQVGYAEALV